jgi:hypothetical protein
MFGEIIKHFNRIFGSHNQYLANQKQSQPVEKKSVQTQTPSDWNFHSKQTQTPIEKKSVQTQTPNWDVYNMPQTQSYSHSFESQGAATKRRGGFASPDITPRKQRGNLFGDRDELYKRRSGRGMFANR